jgi:hypothetical protein
MTRYAFVRDDVATEIPTGTWFKDPEERTYPENWLALSSPQLRTARGIYPITEAGAPPSGQRVASTSLTVVSGLPVEVAELEDIPLGELKAAKIAWLDGERDRRQRLDFVYDFGATMAIDDFAEEIEAGERSLQMGPEDQKNWMVLQGQALAAAAAGSPGAVLPMRAEDNWNVQTTAAQVLTVTSAMVLRNSQLLFFAGGLKSQVRAAEDLAELDAIDLSTGWP